MLLSCYLFRWAGVDWMDRSPWTAIICQDEGWWVGWIAEMPGVNAQERTRPALLASLAEVLQEALEMNRNDALSIAHEGCERVAVTI